MTAVDRLWYEADEARQRAERTYHDLTGRYDPRMEFERTRHVSRARFRTLTGRITENGAPYGAHTLVTDGTDSLLLVRHEGVGKWVLPGGEIEGDETFHEGAVRELREEAGVQAEYDGLGALGRVEFHCDGHTTWGVLPVFEAVTSAETTPEVRDPDDEISAARWFADLPEDTRDRDVLQSWLAAQRE